MNPLLTASSAVSEARSFSPIYSDTFSFLSAIAYIISIAAWLVGDVDYHDIPEFRLKPRRRYTNLINGDRFC